MTPESTTTCCGRPVPGTHAKHGKVLAGTLGTGKSSLNEWEDLGAAVRSGEPVIALDTEGNLAHRLRAVAPRGYKVHRIDATVKGGAVLDIPAMWRTQTQRGRFVQKQSPVHEGSQNQFFEAFTQEVLLAALCLLVKYESTDIRLADLVRLAIYVELLDALGSATGNEEIDSPYATIGMTGRASRDVRATVKTRLRPLMIYAALAERAVENGSELVNPLDLVHGKPCAVVLVFKPRYKKALEGLYSFVIDTVVDEKLTVGDNGKTLHVGLDELTAISKLESLVDLVRRSRKAVVCYTIGIQSVEGVLQIYGQHDGQDILNLPRTKVVMRLGSTDERSLTWGASAMGKPEALQKIQPEAVWHLSDQATIQQAVVDRWNVHPDQVRRSPLAKWTGEAVHVRGWVDFGGRWEPFDVMVPPLTTVPPPEHKPVPDEWEVLRAYQPMDAVRLKLPLDLVKKAAIRKEAFKKRRTGKKKGGEDG